jgi:hypothetical protein
MLDDQLAEDNEFVDSGACKAGKYRVLSKKNPIFFCQNWWKFSRISRISIIEFSVIKEAEMGGCNTWFSERPKSRC